MTSWQRYPGLWTPEDEAARLGGRSEASAPFEEDEEKQQGTILVALMDARNNALNTMATKG